MFDSNDSGRDYFDWDWKPGKKKRRKFPLGVIVLVAAVILVLYVFWS